MMFVDVDVGLLNSRVEYDGEVVTREEYVLGVSRIVVVVVVVVVVVFNPKLCFSDPLEL